MFDPAILLALEAPPPPNAPLIVEEREWQSAAGARMQRIAQRLANNYATTAEAWITALDEMKARIEAMKFPAPASPDELKTVTELIDDWETMAEQRAAQSARLEKRVRRDVKAHFKRDPSIAAATRTFGGRLVEVDKRIIEAILDYALVLRAIRAAGEPDAGTGPIFGDPEALSRHLRGLVGA